MNWADERYVRLYTRDTVGWLALSFDAQALLALVLRKVDRSGVLNLGRLGRRSVAIAIGHPGKWGRLEKALAELEADGCVRVTDEGKLVVLNFIEAQETPASDKKRAREARERHRADVTGDVVTKRDETSRAVTPGHDESHDITPRHSVPSVPCRSVLSVPDQPTETPAGAREVQSAGQKALVPEPEAEPDRNAPPPADEAPGWMNDSSAAPRPRYTPRAPALTGPIPGSVAARRAVCCKCSATSAVIDQHNRFICMGCLDKELRMCGNGGQA